MREDGGHRGCFLGQKGSCKVRVKIVLRQSGHFVLVVPWILGIFAKADSDRGGCGARDFGVNTIFRYLRTALVVVSLCKTAVLLYTPNKCIPPCDFPAKRHAPGIHAKTVGVSEGTSEHRGGTDNAGAIQALVLIPGCFHLAWFGETRFVLGWACKGANVFAIQTMELYAMCKLI